jgi:hypothetical protein
MKFLYFLFIIYSWNIFAINYVKVESTASYRIKELQSKHISSVNKIGDNIVYIADYFYSKGSNYKSHLLDRESYEYLYLSMADTDCFIFAEEVLATALALRNSDLSQFGILKFIQLLRYGNNHQVEYCNRNHYFKQWIISNKKLISDVGFNLTKEYYPYKAELLSKYVLPKEIIKNKKQYINCISQQENNINKESIGFVPINKLQYFMNDIKNGDVIGIVRNLKNADNITHIAIAYRNGDNVGIYHASSNLKKVVKESSLMNYLKKYKDIEGIVIVRLI